MGCSTCNGNPPPSRVQWAAAASSSVTGIDSGKGIVRKSVEGLGVRPAGVGKQPRT